MGEKSTNSKGTAGCKKRGKLEVLTWPGHGKCQHMGGGGGEEFGGRTEKKRVLPVKYAFRTQGERKRS